MADMPVFKKRPVTKTMKTYTQRFDVDVDDEPQPKVEKTHGLSKKAIRLAVQTTLSSYKRTVDDYRRKQKWAPFLDLIEEMEQWKP